MPLIRIISRDNGVGLSRDMLLVAQAARRIPGVEVELLGFQGGNARNRLREAGMRVAALWRGRADVQIFLERIYQRCLPAGRSNLLIPNPEWFLPKWQELLPRFDGVLCKTVEAQATFARLGCAAHYVGFTSEDRHLPGVRRQRRFFHLAGRSSAKNTDLLLRLWARHPEWPQLTVVQSVKKSVPRHLANVLQLSGHVPDDALRRLQNEHLFHLCPSRAEGFGHYIVEGLGVGAIVLTTDGAPMNELVGQDRGVLIATAGHAPENLGVRYEVAEAAIERAVMRALSLDAQAQARISAAARAFFLQQQASFHERFAQVVQQSLSLNDSSAAGVPAPPRLGSH
ncbi:glycosyltransferase [Stenotrophomonas sp. MMGLT7]|uniref:glycosyltransferase n=1 Tax=Stenotrophomonas sp. MMGLT7 TaxID=2901227 RepID=UPI001E4D89FC|nr:glycosyltransferase [Stenotrophomonas sp. MMGLT7]MCD7098385.1 glycosyltransferase [Stenotrophomonas sp. MMGLT7]